MIVEYKIYILWSGKKKITKAKKSYDKTYIPEHLKLSHLTNLYPYARLVSTLSNLPARYLRLVEHNQSTRNTIRNYYTLIVMFV